MMDMIFSYVEYRTCYFQFSTPSIASCTRGWWIYTRECPSIRAACIAIPYTPCRISKTHCSRWVATQIHPELWVYDILLYIINVFVLKEMVTLCALWLDIYYMFSYTPCLHRLTIALSSCLTPSCINRCNINSLGDNMIIQVPWDVILQYYNYILCFRCSNKPSLFEPLGCLSLVNSIQ